MPGNSGLQKNVPLPFRIPYFYPWAYSTTMTAEDKDPWIKFCAGEPDAFRALYDRHYTRMFVWGCKWMNGETAFVKDQLHDFFIYLWEKRANLAREVNVATYLLTAFRRRLQEQRTREQRLQAVYEVMPDVSLDEVAAFSEQFLRVQRALQHLTQAQREVITLRFLHELSLQEIAAAKNTSLRTVYNLMHRALLQLRRQTGKKKFFWLW